MKIICICLHPRVTDILIFAVFEVLQVYSVANWIYTHERLHSSEFLTLIFADF